MRRIGGILIVAAVLILGFVLFGPKKTAPNGEPATNISKTMTITSSAFEHNGKIPKKYTCDGENVNPPLAISGVPEGAKSLVLIMDDPDAPSGTFTHWILYDIDPKIKGIPERIGDEIGIAGETSFGKIGYGGPCPPPGKPHRYFFKLYALDFGLPPIDYKTPPQKEDIESGMEGHILAQAELIGIYGR